MSNYYVSNCCGAEVSEIDIESNTGRCLDCKEMCELEVVIDNKYMNNKPTKEIPKDELDKYTERAVEEPTKEEPTLSTILQEVDKLFEDFYWENGKYEGRDLGITGYKDFLHSQITKAYKAGKEDALETPLGVSQWKNHGEKYKIDKDDLIQFLNKLK